MGISSLDRYIDWRLVFRKRERLGNGFYRERERSRLEDLERDRVHIRCLERDINRKKE